MANDDTMMAREQAIHPPMHVSHVHLWTTDLDRAIAFYRDVLGLYLTQDMREEPVPRRLAFLSASPAYYTHVAFSERPAKAGVPGAPTGLLHFALLYPTRRELARALKRLLDHGYPIESIRDYGVSEVVNVKDPDGNGVELAWDRPPEQWPRVDGKLRMVNVKLEANLLEELPDKGLVSTQGGGHGLA